MATDDDVLFDAPLHTEAKHRLYRFYLDAWLPILLGGRFPRVRIVDGFAGPGRYTGGQEGSPQVAIRAALEHERLRSVLAGPDRVRLLFIEADARRARHLEHELHAFDSARPAGLRWRVEQGEFATVWSGALEAAERTGRLDPTLLFIDAFGYTGFPMALLTPMQGYRACELLINFPWDSVDRWAVNVEERHPLLTELYGDERWRPGRNVSDAWEREQFFVREYQAALADAGWRGTTFRMLNARNQTQYYLVYGTTNSAGMEAFKSAAWRVSQGGRFEFSDLRNPRQEEFGFMRQVTDAQVTDDLRSQIEVQFISSTVEKSALDEFTAWHPMAIGRHLTAALTQLQEVGAILYVDPQRRRGTFPKGSEIRFF